MSWGAIIGAVLGGISRRSEQRAADRAAEENREFQLLAAREMGDESRRTAMFQSDLREYEEARGRERKRGALENFVQFGQTPQGQNRWGFMNNYTPVTNTRETPTRPNYDDYRYVDPEEEEQENNRNRGRGG